jgi:hypothetical protein
MGEWKLQTSRTGGVLLSLPTFASACSVTISNTRSQADQHFHSPTILAYPLQTMARLAELPSEVLLLIIEKFSRQRDISSLARSSKRL